MSDGGPAYPTVNDSGISKRDLFAALAPEPSDDRVEREAERDRMRNPHNEPRKPKLRTVAEIRADLRYEHADAMLNARGKGHA